MILENQPMIGLGLLLSGIALFALSLYFYKKRQLIADTPTSKIRSIAMGIVEIIGQVVPIQERLFKSPFTDKDCVYYHYTIEEYRSSGKNSHWVTIQKAEQKDLFYLRDDTGSVLIDPTDAHIEARRDFEYQSSLGKDPPEQVIRFLTTHHLSHEGFLGINKTMRYQETLIAPDDTLYIMGTAGENPYRKESTANHIDSIMIQKGEHEKHYYITDKSEKQLLTNLSLITYGIGGCGVVFIIMGAILSLQLI